MSYGFSMLFRGGFSEKAGALHYADIVVHSMHNKADMEAYVDDNMISLPSRQHQSCVTPESKTMARIADDEAVRNLFLMKFFYWPEYGLLGMRYTSYPNIEKMFGGKIFRFQNSTDQNYPAEEWGDTCEFFDSCVAKYMNMSDREIYDLDLAEDEDSDTDANDKEAIEYSRLSRIYSAIYNGLDLENYFSEKSAVFTKFSMSVRQSTTDDEIFLSNLANRGVCEVRKMRIYTPLIILASNGKIKCSLLIACDTDKDISDDAIKNKLKDAINEYLQSCDGQRFTSLHGATSWTDALSIVPERLLHKQGLSIVKNSMRPILLTDASAK